MSPWNTSANDASLDTGLSPVITPAQLMTRLGQEGVAIADCRFSLLDPTLGRQQYQSGHIPGAVYFDLNQDLSSPVADTRPKPGGRHPLPDPQVLAQKLEWAGITKNETLVVAYDDSRFGFAARFWWLLRYLGHERVVLLDGGFSRWQAMGYPVTTEVPAIQKGQFQPQVRAEWVVERVDVQQRQEHQKGQEHQQSSVLVDSREGDRFRGEREPIDPVAGHIAGAINYPWQEVTTEEGWVRSPQEQQQRWSGLSNAEEIVVYCGSGVTACVNLLSLELVGIKSGKLYAGSWSEWCSYL